LPLTVGIIKTHFHAEPSPSFPETGEVASLDTRGIIGRKGNSTFIAFGGTDALVWENFWTDFDFKLLQNSDIHRGFQAAFEAVRPKIDVVIDAAKPDVDAGRGRLFLTGHSLGAALAALAAERALERGVEPAALYTFGMPRVGGATFAARYNGRPLAHRTYRLVHGLDIVARVPFPELGFRHIGRVLICNSGKKFGRSDQPTAVGSNDPTLLTRFGISALGALQRVFSSGQVFQKPGPGPFGPLFRLLPQPIRDHLQDRYIAALTP
jgi:triacylglycerol lipase